MKDYILPVTIILFAIGLVVYFEYSLWTECRQTNSFFYCVRVLGQ
jgi:hypothetical protein